MLLLNLFVEEAVAAVVDEKLSQQLEAAQFYSLLIDESMDITTDHTLIMYVWYVKNDEVNMRFFKLTELHVHGGTTDAILDTILHTLEQKSYLLIKVMV